MKIVRANKISFSAYDDKRNVLRDGASTFPKDHYRTVNASIFSDNTDSNQDNKDDNDDNERKMSKTISIVHHEDQDIDTWLKMFE